MATAASGADQQASYNAYQTEYHRNKRAQAQDIAPIPPVENPERRAAAEDSFELFCRTYFPDEFTMPWSECHLRAADRVETAVGSGGKFAFAMPRGSGKTTICEWAVLWVILTGKCRFVLFIGATEKSAEQRIKDIKKALETNDLLYADFPEAVHPVRCLERSNRRTAGQKFNGEPTGIEWLAKRIVMATVRDQQGQVSPCAGAVIDVCGLTGDIRGAKYKTETGESIRPDLVICDDPQTRESAKSHGQSEDRAKIIAGDIAYLAGPSTPTTVLMPCTVIYQDDLADQMLDREKHPEWRGERHKMVISFPENEELWEEYDEIRRQSLESWGDIRDATAFYVQNRAEMDKGAEVYWPERYFEGEASAIQHAMNKKLEDEDAFYAEYQNEPRQSALSDSELLTADQIAARTTALKRFVVPPETTKLITFIDVQKRLLYYVTMAFAPDFTSWIIDYGSYPDQARSYFTYYQAKPILADVVEATSLEGRLYEGLTNLTGLLLERAYERDDGGIQSTDRILIDANWGESTDVVYQFCRQSPHRSTLLPSHGKFVGASNPPLCAHKVKPGEKLHLHCLTALGDRRYRHAVHDSNYWKSFFHKRLATPAGSRGAMTLFEGKHRMFADHCKAESPVEVEGRGRKVDEWKQRPSEPDNHLFDCAVGCCVGANIEGIVLKETENEQKKGGKKLKLSEIQKQKKRGA